MLANVNPRRRSLDRLKRPTDTVGRVRFEIKTFVLGETTRKKDVEDRLCGARTATDDLLVGCPQSTEVIRTQTEQAQGTGLPPREVWKSVCLTS